MYYCIEVNIKSSNKRIDSLSLFTLSNDVIHDCVFILLNDETNEKSMVDYRFLLKHKSDIHYFYDKIQYFNFYLLIIPLEFMSVYLNLEDIDYEIHSEYEKDYKFVLVSELSDDEQLLRLSLVNKFTNTPMLPTTFHVIELLIKGDLIFTESNVFTVLRSEIHDSFIIITYKFKNFEKFKADFAKYHLLKG